MVILLSSKIEAMCVVEWNNEEKFLEKLSKLSNYENRGGGW